MMSHALRTWSTGAAAFAAMTLLQPRAIQAQQCPAHELDAAIQPADRVYRLAQQLSQQLQGSNFVVRCVLRSHMEGVFEGLAGAALYRTDRGDFEAVFLPPTATFDQLVVQERQDGAGWVYSFAGEPKPWPANRMEGSQRRYFVKHANTLLMSADEELAASLERALAAR